MSDVCLKIFVLVYVFRLKVELQLYHILMVIFISSSLKNFKIVSVFVIPEYFFVKKNIKDDATHYSDISQAFMRSKYTIQNCEYYSIDFISQATQQAFS